MAAPKKIKKGGAATAAAPLVPHDFVYAGRRLLRDGTLADELWPLDGKGQLMQARVFKAARRQRVIGGIYTGASFSLGEALGLNAVSYKGKYEAHSTIVEWEARHDQAITNHKLLRTEQDELRAGEIDRALAPLRESWLAMRKSGDHAGTEALELAVLRSLRRTR